MPEAQTPALSRLRPRDVHPVCFLNSQMQRTLLTATSETSRPYFNLATQHPHFELSPQTELVQNRFPTPPHSPSTAPSLRASIFVVEISQPVIKSTSSTQQMRFLEVSSTTVRTIQTPQVPSVLLDGGKHADPGQPCVTMARDRPSNHTALPMRSGPGLT